MSLSPILIGIAGGTGSGKTSIAKKLLEEYGNGDVVVIEQDAYYRDISNIPMEDRHLHNFDHPDAIDIEFFNQQLISLIKGQIVEVPIYDFSTHSRLKDTKTVHPHRVIIVEGILTLHNTILRELMDIKVFGSFLCSKIAAKIMIEQNEGGRIINLSSTAGKEGNARMAAYNAANFAIDGFTQALSKELAENKITVN